MSEVNNGISPSLSIAIVIYNKEMSESITYQNLSKVSCYKSLHIIVVDNSEIKNSNLEYCSVHDIEYISMYGNKGLSKAYNAAIEVSKADDVIILMDDDTDITDNYFITLIKSLQKHPETDIFAPIVYGQDGIIYSPNEFGFLKNHFILDPKQKISKDKFNAIASCLAIRLRVFENYRFNEVLFVDQVDQNFFYDMRAQARIFRKLPVEIHQNFYQRGAELTPEAGWRRLSLRIKDIMRQGKMYGMKYVILAWIKCLGLGIQIGRKSSSICIPIRAFVLCTKYVFV